MTDVAAPQLTNVIVLAVHDMTRRTVTEQGRLKTQIEDLVRSALRSVPVERRIVLDAPQGIVIALLDRPRAALEFAERALAGVADLPVCIGINHGAVTVMDDENRGQALVGEGIHSGMTMAEAASPARIMASRPFLESLQADSPESAARLSPAGIHTDAQVRAHELFALNNDAARARRRRLFLMGVTGFTGILLLGVVARMALFGSGLRAAPAVIQFQVAPAGDVYIDGVLKGKSPPLKTIEIPPGQHTIEVRNSPYPPLKLEINPGPAEEMIIAHTFQSRSAGAKQGDKSLRESARDGWRSFRRGVGF